MDFLIIWPERRRVSAAIMRGWFDDAVANGDVEPITEDSVEADVARAKSLDDAGLLTLGKDTETGEWQ